VEPLFLTAGDGTRLACWEFGEGRGVPVVMLHGSGLNGHCWAPVAALLAAEGFRPLALDLRGHGSSGRSPNGDYHWQLFADDVLVVVEQLGLTGAAGGAGAPGNIATSGEAGGALAVGHSAGATALLLAEAARPGTFSRLWTWEPIMSTPSNDLRQVGGARLAERARRRRASFASVAEARSHFEGRGIFADFAPESLEAFLSGAFVPAAGGVRLACQPEDEANMYESGGSHDAWEQLSKVCCPSRVLGGQLSSAVPLHELEKMAARLPAGEAAALPGLGHFGPFQSPAVISADITSWLNLPK
jgi:pimeloyl-ACP methyl ester carboxylesterase